MYLHVLQVVSYVQYYYFISFSIKHTLTENIYFYIYLICVVSRPQNNHGSHTMGPQTSQELTVESHSYYGNVPWGSTDVSTSSNLKHI